jgi:hypothetical protein
MTILLLISVACFDISGHGLATTIMTWLKSHPFWTVYLIIGIEYNLSKLKQKGKAYEM